MGIGTIMEADQLLLLATGPTKASALAAAVEGPLSASVPASVLQLHPQATVIVDQSAAAELVNSDYYIETAANRPDWQQP
jgi:glucosamine-6-phosphate deaminase